MSSSSKTVRGWRGFGRIGEHGQLGEPGARYRRQSFETLGLLGLPRRADHAWGRCAGSGVDVRTVRHHGVRHGAVQHDRLRRLAGAGSIAFLRCAGAALDDRWPALHWTQRARRTAHRAERRHPRPFPVKHRPELGQSQRSNRPRVTPPECSPRRFPVKQRRRRTGCRHRGRRALRQRPRRGRLHGAVSRETSGAGDEGAGGATRGDEPGVVSRETPSYDVDLALAAELSLKNTSTGRLPDSPGGVLGMSAPRPRPSARRFSLNSINLSQARTAGC